MNLINRLGRVEKTQVKEKARIILIKHDLTGKDRVRIKNYKRICIAQFLRDNGVTFQEIADMMNRNHATVVHMIKNYNLFISYQDFKTVARDMFSELIDRETLEERVLRCQDYWEMVKLQKELKEEIHG